MISSLSTDPTLQGDTISANVTFRPDFTPIIHLAIKVCVAIDLFNRAVGSSLTG